LLIFVVSLTITVKTLSI